MVGDIMNLLSGGNDQRAADMQGQILRDVQNIPLPVLKEYYPELYKVVAEMNPEIETAVTLGPSQMQGIATDPSLRQAQLNALARLEQVGLGGQSAEDLARAAQVEQDVNTNLQGQMGAIGQNLAARGLSGSGLDLVQRNMAAQGAANRQATMALENKAQAERRALEAIMQSGQVGGQMQAQDFAQQQAKAQAADAIARFNAQNYQNVMGQNVDRRNQAQMYNVGTQQDVAGMNTGARNEAQQRNLNLAQQQYENELRKRGLVSGAQQSVADMYQRRGDAQRQFIGGLIGAGAKAYGGS